MVKPESHLTRKPELTEINYWLRSFDFAEPSTREQVWLWVRRRYHRPNAVREFRYERDRDEWAKRLSEIALPLEHEVGLTLTKVVLKVDNAFCPHPLWS